MKFIHISDLHFHRDPKDNKDATRALDKIAAKYTEHNIIVTGDISDDGHEEQFENAYEALSKFMTSDGSPRIFICPGNHDFGAAGNFYSEERARRFDKILSVPLKQKGTFTGDNTPVVNILREGSGANSLEVMLIALDTNLETEHPFDFACGEVGKCQLAALKTLINDPEASKMKKILFFHHHPFMHNDPFMEMKDARDLIRTIYKRVDLVLFGHRHVSEIWKNRNEIPYMLASDNFPGKKFAREINISTTEITVKDAQI